MSSDTLKNSMNKPPRRLHHQRPSANILWPTATNKNNGRRVKDRSRFRSWAEAQKRLETNCICQVEPWLQENRTMHKSSKTHWQSCLPVSDFTNIPHERPVSVRSDQKPLKSIFSQPLNKAPPRIRRLPLRLQRLTFHSWHTRNSHLEPRFH